MTAFCTVSPLNAKAELIDPARTRPVSSCETWLADMWCCRQLASRKRRCNTPALRTALAPEAGGADDLRALLHCRDCGKAGIDAYLRRRRLAPQPAIPHRRERFAHAGATGEPKAFTCLLAALRGRVRCDVLNNAPILMNLSRMVAKSALLRGLVSGRVQDAQCNPVEGLVLGAVTNAPLGRFTRITPTS